MNANKANIYNPSTKLKTIHSPIFGMIQTIKIPLIRPNGNQQNESDLTELSWLTNNINMLNSPIPTSKMHNMAYISQPKTCFSVINSKSLNKKHRNSNFITKYEDTTSNLFISPESPSSLSSSSLTSTSSSTSSISPCLSPCSAYNSTEKKSKKLKIQKSSSISKKFSSHKINLSSLTNSSTKPSQTNEKFKNDCGLNKPPLTLSCLIFMALEESKQKCLPVREIYEWIEDNFPFYKTNQNSGWKSSIRHNLSFSKCFKKMDRTESVFYRPKLDLISITELGRKRRAPNSVGTCWKVNDECKNYLIQTLKKSNFWIQNSKYYPNLESYVSSFDFKDFKNNHHKHQNIDNKLIFKKSNEDISYDESSEYNSNLLEFVQKQQEKLVEQVNPKLKKDQKELDLSLSASSVSLSSAFSSLSSNFKDDDDDDDDNSSSKRLKIVEDSENEECKKQVSNLSSDLEMEVASTLVDMKWFATRNRK